MNSLSAARWLLVAAWCGVIFFFSAQSQLPGPADYALDAVFKKCGHLTAYGVLMVLLLAATRAQPKPAPRNLALCFAVLTAYACTDEFHQSFVPGRTSQFIDVLIDNTGALLGLTVWRAWHGASWQRLRYWLLFALCAWVLLMLNLPLKHIKPQDMSVVFSDPWLLFGFCYFGLLLTCVAVLLIEDAVARGMRWAWFVPPYFVVGILVLAPYLALRPARDHTPLRRIGKPLSQLMQPGWRFWLVPVAVVVLGAVLLPRGSWSQFGTASMRSVGFLFMWLDIGLNHICALPLLSADLARRGQRVSPLWLLATAITGPLALGAYLATRKRV